MTAWELARHARREAGLSQTAVAQRLGTSQAAVAKLERPGANPTVMTLDRLLRATGHQLTLSAPAQEATIDEEQLLRHLRMSPAERARTHDAGYAEVRKTVRGARRL